MSAAMYPSLDCLWASGVSPVSLLKVLGEKSPYCYSALYPDRFLPGEIMCRNFFFSKTDYHAQDKVLDFILSWWLGLVQQAQQWYMHG